MQHLVPQLPSFSQRPRPHSLRPPFEGLPAGNVVRTTWAGVQLPTALTADKKAAPDTKAAPATKTSRAMKTKTGKKFLPLMKTSRVMTKNAK